jgi:hypothetical protein
MLAAKFDRRAPHIDRNPLTASGAHAPDLGGRERGGGDRRLRCRADREGRRQYGLGPRQIDIVERRGIKSGIAPQLRERGPRLQRMSCKGLCRGLNNGHDLHPAPYAQ